MELFNNNSFFTLKCKKQLKHTKIAKKITTNKIISTLKKSSGIILITGSLSGLKIQLELWNKIL